MVGKYAEGVAKPFAASASAKGTVPAKYGLLDFVTDARPTCSLEAEGGRSLGTRGAGEAPLVPEEWEAADGTSVGVEAMEVAFEASDGDVRSMAELEADGRAVDVLDWRLVVDGTVETVANGDFDLLLEREYRVEWTPPALVRIVPDVSFEGEEYNAGMDVWVPWRGYMDCSLSSLFSHAITCAFCSN